MIKLKDLILEGVMDTGILKAVFLAEDLEVVKDIFLKDYLEYQKQLLYLHMDLK